MFETGPTRSTQLSDATRLREAMMNVTRQARRFRPPHGMTMTQIGILGDLDRHGVQTVADLAARAQVRVQSLTPSVNGLHDRGFVTRTEDASDRRRQLIELSAAGRAVLQRDRIQRDQWIALVMEEQLSDIEKGLLMLCIPVLGKLVDDRTAIDKCN